MRINSVHIENFRSIKQLTCDFGDVTSLIGPNGAGKSNVLRALDWFFNGGKDSLTSQDVHLGTVAADGGAARIRVRVEFHELTPDDRSALGPRYCPSEKTETFTAWRTWESGTDKITGKALAYPPFETIRKSGSASEKRSSYSEFRSSHPYLSLPSCNSAAAVDAAMDAWERSNPESLEEAEVSDTHFFGIGGQGKLADLFDFVFVSADLRAVEETSSARNSLLSRILQRAVVREDFETEASALAEEFAGRYERLAVKHLDGQLQGLAEELTSEVNSYAHGREIRLRHSQARLRPEPSAVEVQIAQMATETPVELQGHGFQRALLLAALTVLSRRSRPNGTIGQMFLAVEEPELFQHPTQARAFASVLRQLASDPTQRMQVAYATHSPHFIDPSCFDEVRRVSTARSEGSEYTYSTLKMARLRDTAALLKGYVATMTLERRWEQVCLKALPEALFAEGVILVEGDDDAAVLQGMGGRINSLAVGGVCVAPVGGKGNMLIPFAILAALGIPALMVVDNDSGCGERMRLGGKDESDIEKAVAKHVADNRKLCRFVGEAEEDFPTGAVGATLAFVPDTMETLLQSELPGWDLTRRELIEQGRGVDGKNAATYALAARECVEEPGEHLRGILHLCAQVA